MLRCIGNCATTLILIATFTAIQYGNVRMLCIFHGIGFGCTAINSSELENRAATQLRIMDWIGIDARRVQTYELYYAVLNLLLCILCTMFIYFKTSPNNNNTELLRFGMFITSGVSIIQPLFIIYYYNMTTFYFYSQITFAKVAIVCYVLQFISIVTCELLEFSYRMCDV